MIKKLICMLLGHQWPIIHVGDYDYKRHDWTVTNYGHCGRCGKDSGNHGPL